MKVSELIALLQKFPGDVDVIGYDNDGAIQEVKTCFLVDRVKFPDNDTFFVP